MNITVAQALKLFTEANDFVTERQRFIGVGSEIRALAQTTFMVANISTLEKVCAEIFRVVAEHHVAQRGPHAEIVALVEQVLTDPAVVIELNREVIEVENDGPFHQFRAGDLVTLTLSGKVPGDDPVPSESAGRHN